MKRKTQRIIENIFIFASVLGATNIFVAILSHYFGEKTVQANGLAGSILAIGVFATLLARQHYRLKHQQEQRV